MCVAKHVEGASLCFCVCALCLPQVAIQQLGFEDVWQMFGEGVHPRFDDLFERQLSPFLSQTSNNFWSSRKWYFSHGLYYQGGMVRGTGGGGKRLEGREGW
jgi:hypothetical protein